MKSVLKSKKIGMEEDEQSMIMDTLLRLIRWILNGIIPERS